jgi:hypothetical protein
MKGKDDAQAETKREFKRVQAAKVIHRLASGTHRRWPQGNGKATELHAYPASRGLVLRHVGEDLERAIELLAEKYLEAERRETKRRSAGEPVRAAPRRLRVRRRVTS